MKYNDSIKQANKKMSLSVDLLQQWHLPAIPINFAVSYAYISKNNKLLTLAIDQHLQSNKRFDEFFMNEMYKQYILGESAFREDIITDLDDMLDVVHKGSQSSVNSMTSFIEKLDSNVKSIESNNVQQRQRGLNQLKDAARKIQYQQQLLASQLLDSKKQSTSLRKELNNVRDKLFIDPLTGLYNRKAMNQHVDTWFKDDPEKQVAAIVINVDDFDGFNQRFGQLISNVVLSKVAQKVSSYVDDSGFPVRTAGDEFFILLPDMHTNIAREIASKIQQGVDKLRFRSTKTGVSLPKLNMSFAISEMNIQESVERFIHRSRKLILPTMRVEEAVLSV